MLDWLNRMVDILAGYLDQDVILPILYRFGWMRWDEMSFDWAVIAVFGFLSVILTMAVCWPLEKIAPVERWHDQGAVWSDVIYTLIARAGILPVASFIVFYQVQTGLNGWLAEHGYIPPTLETFFPWLTQHPVASFALYALLLDAADYWRHRLSHTFYRWYALHALHHAQRQMSFWSDDRNHVLDDVISVLWFGVVALILGVPPLQFPLLNMALKFVESLSHANTRLSYGRIGERLLVSPRFHRLHHAGPGAGRRSCNFAAVFPIWDIIFRTANFAPVYLPTGDKRAPEAMATGSWRAQQAAGLQLLFKKRRKG